MITCNSEYCPILEKCLRHVSNYPQGVFERVNKSDMTEICKINNYVNFKEMKDADNSK